MTVISRRGALATVGGTSAVALLPFRSSADSVRLLPTTLAALTDRRRQLYVERGGHVLADTGRGASAAGVPISDDTLVFWASAVKPTTVAAAMRLVEAGRVDLDDPVTRFIPEFAANGKEGVLIRHLMTHSAQLGGYAGPIGLPPFATVIARIIAAPRELGRTASPGAALPPPGVETGYNPAGIWILGEILQRLHQRPFAEVIRTEIFIPCGMRDSWNGLPPTSAAVYGDRLSSLRDGPMSFRGAGGRPERLAPAAAGGAALAASNPAGGGIGPSHDLGRFYRMLLDKGSVAGKQVLSPASVAAMRQPRISDGRLWSWGLGLNLNTIDSPIARRRFGGHASPSAFGHAGASGMMAFADPALDLVVVALPGEDIIEHIYADLAAI